MTNRSKAKGTAWETKIVDELQADGFDDARRVVLAGAHDQGDVHVGPVGRPLISIEAKNENRMAVAEYIGEANTQGDHANATYGGVAWIHRRGKGSPRDGYVVMDGATWLRILRALTDAQKDHQ